jgi:hypothetical protein
LIWPKRRAPDLSSDHGWRRVDANALLLSIGEALPRRFKRTRKLYHFDPFLWQKK